MHCTPVPPFSVSLFSEEEICDYCVLVYEISCFAEYVLGYCAEFVCRSCFFLLIKVSPVNEQKVVIPPPEVCDHA